MRLPAMRDSHASRKSPAGVAGDLRVIAAAEGPVTMQEILAAWHLAEPVAPICRPAPPRWRTDLAG
jgi:hypothetical protein